MLEESTSEIRVKVPWGEITAKAYGEPGNTRVLMVHGTLDNAGTFNRLIKLMPNNMYYVCIDLPGHGLSSHFPSGVPLNYFDYILAIRYVLDELKWENTYYVGHSFGAHLGLTFSLIYPDIIKKLVLLDGCIPLPTPNDQLIIKIRNDHELAIKFHVHNKPPSYTKQEILNALMDPKNDRLTLEAAEALFERSVTKVEDDFYNYNRDPRARTFVVPNLSVDQGLYLVSQLKVDTLLILATNTTPFFKEIQPKIIDILKNVNNVNIIKVDGNHDVHNNFPKKISMEVSKFLSHTLVSKL